MADKARAMATDNGLLGEKKDCWNLPRGYEGLDKFPTLFTGFRDGTKTHWLPKSYS